MVTLDQILEPGFLRKIHKRIRDQTRAQHLTSGLVVRDPLLLAPADFELDKTFRLLKLRVQDGTYRPKAVQVVHAAKAVGLRRPLTYMQHDDAVLLKALCEATRVSLFKDFPIWVSFGREHVDDETKRKSNASTGDVEPAELPYEGWFTKWLKYMKLLSVIAGDDRSCIVISDVANFFPSVDLTYLRDRFNRATSLDVAATDLLFYIVSQLHASTDRSVKAPLGLPQDPYDASRTLAHFFLQPLDDAFQSEGRVGRYTRWVDDIAVSVTDRLEGSEVITRIQAALAREGLHPNSNKTTVMSKDDFRRDHYENYNDLLDHVHNQTDLGTVLPELRRTFEHRLCTFLLESPRKRYWYRVLRRFYTESRRIGSTSLADLAASHLEESPAEAAHIFDYLAFCHSPVHLPKLLFDHLKREGRLYEDVQIFGYESLTMASLPDDPLLRWFVVKNAYHHLRGLHGFVQPSDYVSGLICLVLYKFGGQRAMNLVAKDFPSAAERSAILARHGFLVLYATGEHMDMARRAIKHLDDPPLRQIERFMIALESGDDKAVRLTLGLLEPKRTRLPERMIVPARVLPLLAIAQRSPKHAGPVLSRIRQVLARLTAQPKELQDGILISHLQ